MVELLIFFGIDVYLRNKMRQDAEELAQELCLPHIAEMIRMRKAKLTIKFNMWKFREYDRMFQVRRKFKGKLAQNIPE